MGNTDPGSYELPEGLVAFVKRDCPTCELVAGVLLDVQQDTDLAVFSQDDPSFPEAVVGVVDDVDLAASWHWDIETVPTILRIEDGVETGRTVGWSREQWEDFTGIEGLGKGLPPYRPGCGSLSVDPSNTDRLLARYGGSGLVSRRVDVAELEDPFEAMFDLGWSDGLPVVPPTESRVLRMLEGTTRDPDEVVAVVPPNLVDCTVEKVAVNAVMAGCRPEYLPVVIAAIEAACNDQFNMHGLLATTMPVGPVLVVNGPIRNEIGMNAHGNVLGQGNRANLTIGRALQLVVRNVGGGRPGEVDRATHGNPGKLSFCFPEDEEGSPWTPLSVDLGYDAGVDTVTLFPGEGPRCIVDQLSRDPESLARSFAANLQAMHHPKLAMAFDAILVVSPDHSRVFRDAGWSKAELVDRLRELLTVDGAEMIRGAGGIAEGVPEGFADSQVPKLRDGGLLVVHAGGGAGLFSSIIGGWVNGAMGSDPVIREIRR